MSAAGIVGRILVVDDHVDLAENLAEILEGAGYEAVVAVSAEAALERIARGDIAALITDFRLPGRNGAELIAELRRRGNRLPAVVMSAFTDDDTIAHARRAGAADVLSKPVPLDRLLHLVATLGQTDGLVLVVDDNRELAENLAEVLRSRGHRTAVCGSVAEVRGMAAPPTVAILDYRLPDGTGVDVARDLLTRDAGVRLLFISGYGPDLPAGLGGGLTGAPAAQLDKPVDVERLLAWVAEALGRGVAASPRR